MFFPIFKNLPVATAGVTLLTALLSPSAGWTHGGSHGANGTQSQKPADNPNTHAPVGQRYDPAFRAPHGGQLSKTMAGYFEVVYGPQETRIYVYDMFRSAQSASGVQGWTTMRVRGNDHEYRYPVQYVPVASGQDYLVARVDVTRIRDGDMEVEFGLEGVPSQLASSTQFTQTFALTAPRIQVVVAALTEADRPLVERQRDCPVMDAGLNDHGQPIKLLVGNETLFVCCEGCVDSVKKNPRQFLAKAEAAQAHRPVPRAEAKVGVFWAGPADDAAIRAQATCPVMNQRLGGHGKPIKVVIDGRPIFVCCQGCIEKVVQNPDLYLSNVVHQQQTDRYARDGDRFEKKPGGNAGSSCCSSKSNGASCH